MSAHLPATAEHGARLVLVDGSTVTSRHAYRHDDAGARYADDAAAWCLLLPGAGWVAFPPYRIAEVHRLPLEHHGMYGACCAATLPHHSDPTFRAAHDEWEAAWRYHWGWVDGTASARSTVGDHLAPDYRRGWTDAQAARDAADLAEVAR